MLTSVCYGHGFELHYYLLITFVLSLDENERGIKMKAKGGKDEMGFTLLALFCKEN